MVEGPVPVATVGVVNAVNSPVATSRRYIDIVLPLKFVA